MQTTNLNVRTDHEAKSQAEAVFNELGITMTAAINFFLRVSICAHGIPFPLTIDTPSSITKAAIEEGRRIAKDHNVKGYNDMSELRAALET